MLHVTCTRQHPGHLIVPVGGSLWRSEEIAKDLELRLSMGLLLLWKRQLRRVSPLGVGLRGMRISSVSEE